MLIAFAQAKGINVKRIGLATTPMCYFGANYYGTNAANNNGYKSNDRRYLNYFFNSKVIETITDENKIKYDYVQICKKYDLVSPIYKTSFRGGCWFCIKQSIKQLRGLYKEHKDLWNILKEMEKDSHNTFRPDYTIEQLEERFKKEQKQMTIYDYMEE